MNKILKRILFNKSIKFVDGEIHLLGIPDILLPIQGVVHLYKLLEEQFGKKGTDTLFNMMETLGSMAAIMTLKRYGLKNKAEAIKTTIEHGEFLGMGETKIVRLDLKTNTFILTLNSAFAKEYAKTYGIGSGMKVDVLARGAFTGIISALLERNDMVCIETECIVEGKKQCSFVVKPKSKFKDLSKYKDQIPTKFKGELITKTNEMIRKGLQQRKLNG